MKTALDFLLSKTAKHCFNQQEIEQAKEMEKQQIINACNLQRNDYKGMPTYNKSGEQYYNETFKTNG
jgi:hypothetical protein